MRKQIITVLDSSMESVKVAVVIETIILFHHLVIVKRKVHRHRKSYSVCTVSSSVNIFSFRWSHFLIADFPHLIVDLVLSSECCVTGLRFSLTSHGTQETCCGKTGPCHCFHSSLRTTELNLRVITRSQVAKNTHFHVQIGFHFTILSYFLPDCLNMLMSAPRFS